MQKNNSFKNSLTQPEELGGKHCFEQDVDILIPVAVERVAMAMKNRGRF